MSRKSWTKNEKEIIDLERRGNHKLRMKRKSWTKNAKEIMEESEGNHGLRMLRKRFN